MCALTCSWRRLSANSSSSGAWGEPLSIPRKKPFANGSGLIWGAHASQIACTSWGGCGGARRVRAVRRSGVSRRKWSSMAISPRARFVGSLRLGAWRKASSASWRLGSAAGVCWALGFGAAPAGAPTGVAVGPCAATGSTAGAASPRGSWVWAPEVAGLGVVLVCCSAASSSMSSGWEKLPLRAGSVMGVGSSGRLSRALW